MRFGLPLPERIQNAPELWPGLALYFNGYVELTSCRSIGMGVGPIPVTDIVLYCNEKGLEGEQREDFLWIVQHLDQKYLDWSSKRGKSGTVQPSDRSVGKVGKPSGGPANPKGRARR